MGILKRLLCFHLNWVEAPPWEQPTYGYLWLFGKTKWICTHCGKSKYLVVGEEPIQYIGEE